MRIALIGTRGVPAQYGGFETCVEEVGSRLAEAGHEVVVFCRPQGDSSTLVDPTRYSSTSADRTRYSSTSADRTRYSSTSADRTRYKGMRLVRLPVVRRRSLETLAHTALSVVHREAGASDAAIVFNAANAPLIPVLRARRVPVATHVDGLEWRRGKWGPVGQRYYRAAESLAVRWSDALIADAQGISDYYRAEFDADTELIAYGAPVIKVGSARIAELGLEPKRFHLVVARLEPENHALEAVQGYVASKSRWPLVVVGTAPYAGAYIKSIEEAADSRVRMIGGIWDQELLDELYGSSAAYVHGHSVGGTNPSLLRAAGSGAHVLAYDVGFNREVLGGRGAYWRTPSALASLFEGVESTPERALEDGRALQRDITRYNWEDVAAAYERLCHRLAAGIGGPRPSGRRRHAEAWRLDSPGT